MTQIAETVTAYERKFKAWLWLQAWPYLKFSGVDPIIALNKRITQVVDAELLQTLQCLIAEVQIIWVPDGQVHSSSKSC